MEFNYKETISCYDTAPSLISFLDSILAFCEREYCIIFDRNIDWIKTAA